MRPQHRPTGPRPTSLESNVLKLRAYEMILVLFYMEDLKRFIIQSIDATDRVRSQQQPQGGNVAKPGKKMDAARERLVSAGVLTQAESDELFELIDYRNLIGHNVQELTVAVGANAHLASKPPGAIRRQDRYAPGALGRATFLREKVHSGMRKGFVLIASFDLVKFEAAEQTYLREIGRLKAKVDRGITQTNAAIDDANQSLRAIPTEVIDTAQPWAPRHRRANGNLSASGKQCIFTLYAAGALPLAAAHLMELSIRSAQRWHRQWQQKM